MKIIVYLQKRKFMINLKKKKNADAICNACQVVVKVAHDACFEGCAEVLLQVMWKGQDRTNKLSTNDQTLSLHGASIQDGHVRVQ